MKREEAEQFWHNEQLERHPILVEPSRSISWEPFSELTTQWLWREDKRLTKALELLRNFDWADTIVTDWEHKEHCSSPSFQDVIRRSLMFTLSDQIKEHMVEGHYEDQERRARVYQATIVFLPPPAAKYIADTLEKQEKRIAELEQQIKKETP